MRLCITHLNKSDLIVKVVENHIEHRKQNCMRIAEIKGKLNNKNVLQHLSIKGWGRKARPGLSCFVGRCPWGSRPHLSGYGGAMVDGGRRGRLWLAQGKPAEAI
jgi:hypothetical protein